jgi:hypothetical protein
MTQLKCWLALLLTDHHYADGDDADQNPLLMPSYVIWSIVCHSCRRTLPRPSWTTAVQNNAIVPERIAARHCDKQGRLPPARHHRGLCRPAGPL